MEKHLVDFMFGLDGASLLTHANCDFHPRHEYIPGSRVKKTSRLTQKPDFHAKQRIKVLSVAGTRIQYIRLGKRAPKHPRILREQREQCSKRRSSIQLCYS